MPAQSKRNSRPKSLVSKLAEALDAVPAVEKKGDNGSYSYQRAADLSRAIRHEIFSRNMLLLTEEKKPVESTVDTNGGGKLRKVTLETEFTVLDGDSDQKIVRVHFGEGTGAKALYKAKTGALKYFLKGLGMVPDEKDDPEYGDQQGDEPNDDGWREAVHYDYSAGQDESSPATRRRGRKGSTQADYQVRAFAQAANEGKKTQQQCADFLKARFGMKGIAELSPDQCDEAVRWALGTEPIAETLATSADVHKKPNGAEQLSLQSKGASA